jgi:hypothetical protein
MLDEVIDDKIAEGGEGSYGPGGIYPSMQVARTTTTTSGGFLQRSAATYFNIAASVRPDSDAVLHDDPEGRYTIETRKLYTHTAELWPSVGATSAVNGVSHDADTVTLYPIASTIDLSDFLADVDAVLASVVVGPDSNTVTLQLIADGSGAGSLDESAWPALKYHFEPTVTTDANLVAAIEAGTKLSIVDAGTGANTFVIGDVQTLHFTGGGGETWRVVKCARYRTFWKAIIERLDRP